MIGCLTEAPAGLLGLNAGTLTVGAAADVTLIDPNEVWTVDARSFRSRSRNTPFDGRRVTGRVVTTIVGGDVKYSTRAS
ncbi:MAG: amidohydrolase family protein [Planctomycetaceae bacterium]